MFTAPAELEEPPTAEEIELRERREEARQDYLAELDEDMEFWEDEDDDDEIEGS